MAAPASPRRFGLVLAAALAVVAGIVAYRAGALVSGGPFVAVAAVLALLAIAAPRALAPVERVWMRLAHALSIVSTFVILTLVFVLAIVPMGLLLRLLRRDLLGLRIDRARTSYWEPIEPDGPSSRPERPF